MLRAMRFQRDVDESEADAPDSEGRVVDPSIGDIFRQTKALSTQQIDEILAYQKRRKLRFGEAAVALKYASREEVVRALSQQYRYPLASGLKGQVHEDLVVGLDPFGDSAEVFRDLRSQFISGALAPNGDKKALAVVSPEIGDGKSYFSANLALSFSQLGVTTLLIDADLRFPTQHKLFSLQPDFGLSGVLAGRSEGDAIHSVPQFPTLHVMPAGPIPPNPSELVQRGGFNLLMDELKSKFDYVIVDTPAATHGPDARIIAACAGVSVMLTRAGRTNAKPARNFVHGLRQAGSEVAGVIFNRF